MLKTIISALLGIFLFISCSGKSERENFEIGLKYYTENDYIKAEKYLKKAGRKVSRGKSNKSLSTLSAKGLGKTVRRNTNKLYKTKHKTHNTKTQNYEL